MKISLSKKSTSILDVFIKDVSQIKSGIISLYIYLGKDNSEKIAELPYERDELYYSFDLSRREPKSIGDFDYYVEVSDGSSSEESRKAKIMRGVPHHIAGAVKKIQNDFRIVAKTHNGSRIYMFKKMPGDEKCTECWDEDLMASNNSNCPICGGTGFVKYYSKPYKSYGSAINFVNEKYGTQDQGKTMEDTTVRMSAIADFVLTTDDMVYYEKTGDIYRVKARTLSELQTIPTLQMLIMDLMPSDAPESEIVYNYIKELKRK